MAFDGFSGEESGGGPLESFGPIAVVFSAVRSVFGGRKKRKFRLPPIGSGATQFSSFIDRLGDIGPLDIVLVRQALEVEQGLRPSVYDDTIVIPGFGTQAEIVTNATLERSGLGEAIIDVIRQAVITVGAAGIGQVLNDESVAAATEQNAANQLPASGVPQATAQEFPETIQGRGQLGSNLQEGTIAGSRGDQFGPFDVKIAFPQLPFDVLNAVEIPTSPEERKKIALNYLGQAVSQLARFLIGNYLTKQQRDENVRQQLNLERQIFDIRNQPAANLSVEEFNEIRDLVDLVEPQIQPSPVCTTGPCPPSSSTCSSATCSSSCSSKKECSCHSDKAA